MTLSSQSIDDVLIVTPSALSSPSIGALAAGLAKAQGKMGKAVRKVTNELYGSSYSDLEAISDAIGDSLSSNGLSYIQRSYAKAGFISIETIILHESGEYLSGGIISVPVEGAMNIQDHAMAITYVRRYGVQTTFGIVSKDDDGNTAVLASQVVRAPAVTVNSVVQPKTVTELAGANGQAPSSHSEQEQAVTDHPETLLLKQKLAAIKGLTDVSRVRSFMLRASEFFTQKENIVAFISALTVRENELAPPAGTVAEVVTESAPNSNSSTEEFRTECITLKEKIDFAHGISDIPRLERAMAPTTVNSLFKFEENRSKFLVAVTKHIEELKLAVPA